MTELIDTATKRNNAVAEKNDPATEMNNTVTERSNAVTGMNNTAAEMNITVAKRNYTAKEMFSAVAKESSTVIKPASAAQEIRERLCQCLTRKPKQLLRSFYRPEELHKRHRKGIFQNSLQRIFKKQHGFPSAEGLGVSIFDKTIAAPDTKPTSKSPPPEETFTVSNQSLPGTRTYDTEIKPRNTMPPGESAKGWFTLSLKRTA